LASFFLKLFIKSGGIITENRRDVKRGMDRAGFVVDFLGVL
jgi:hypothetical protein